MTCQPHAGLPILKDHNRFERGGRIADVTCHHCGNVWNAVNLGALPVKPYRYCEDCKVLHDRAGAMAARIWDATQPGGLPYRGGEYGFRDALFLHWLGKASLPGFWLRKCAALGFNIGAFVNTIRMRSLP